MKDLFVTFLLIGFFSSSVGASDVCLSLQNPISQAKDNFSSDQLDELGKLPAKVNWKKIDNASYYVLSISRTPDFKKARSFKRVSRHMPLMVYPNTKYYWKVSAFNKNGEPLNKDTFQPFKFTTNYTGKSKPPSQWLTLYKFYKKKAREENLEHDTNSAIILNATAAEEYPNDILESENLSSFPETEIAGGVLEIEDEVGNKQVVLSKENYQIYCNQQRSVASISELETKVNDYPVWLQGNKAWVSTEAGMIDFNQNFQQVIGLPVVQSKGLMFPSFSVHFQSERYWGLRGEAYFQQLIGYFDVNTPGVVLLDKDFNWLTFGAHFDYSLTNFSLFNRRTAWSLYAGGEKIKTPYFSLVSPGFIAVEDLDVVNAYIGARLETEQVNNWSYFVDLRYSHPVSSKSSQLSDATINSSLLMDIRLGGSYEINNGFFTGLTFKGMHRDFKESFSNNTFTNAQGQRKTIYFAIEAMAGIDF